MSSLLAGFDLDAMIADSEIESEIVESIPNHAKMQFVSDDNQLDPQELAFRQYKGEKVQALKAQIAQIESTLTGRMQAVEVGLNAYVNMYVFSADLLTENSDQKSTYKAGYWLVESQKFAYDKQNNVVYHISITSKATSNKFFMVTVVNPKTGRASQKVANLRLVKDARQLGARLLVATKYQASWNAGHGQALIDIALGNERVNLATMTRETLQREASIMTELQALQEAKNEANRLTFEQWQAENPVNDQPQPKPESPAKK